MNRAICQVVLGLIVMLVVPVWAGEVGAPPSVKEQIVKLLASISMKMNFSIDEKFCRQFFEDFKKQHKIEYVQPIIQADRVDDPKLAPFFAKCPTVKWIGDETDEPGYRLNTKEFRHQLAPTLVGTAHFRLYKVDIDNNKANGKEHVFYSDKFVREPPPGEELPPVHEGDNTSGEYVAVDFEDCAVLGGVTVGDGGTPEFPIYNGVIRYRGRLYLYDLMAAGGYKLYLNELTARQDRFKIICRYWQ